MPVRSSVCTYSPSSVTTSSKYSTVLPASSPIGNYKPLSSLSSSYATGRSLSSGNKLASSRYSSPGSSSTRTGYASGLSSSNNQYNLTSTTSTYSPHAHLSGSYSSPSSSSNNSASSGYSSSSLSSYSSGNYRPLISSTHNSFSSGRYGSSSTGSSTLTPGAAAAATTSHYNRYSSGSSTGSASSTSLSSAGSSLLDRELHLTIGYSSGSSYSSSIKPSSLRRSKLSSTQSSDDTQQLPSGVPRGLINLGNTCYMNASIQSLYSVESFRNLVLRAGYDKQLTSELGDLFKMMKNNTTTEPVSPANFKCAFSRYQQKFSGFGQQDAQEFLRYLINGIHEESNQASSRPRRSTPPKAPRSAQEAWSLYREIVDDSQLVDLVVGQMCSTIVCGVCQNKSICWDPFWDLSLPLVRGRHTCKLSEVIQDFIAKETLDSDERPICSHCKRATRSTKQINLCRLPPLMILHLKKFTNDGYKMSSPDVKIDRVLTLENGTNYQLQACISHHGHSSSSGHYTSHCRYSSRWFHFNDEKVRDVTSSFDNEKLNDAYVLFYTRQQ